MKIWEDNVSLVQMRIVFFLLLEEGLLHAILHELAAIKFTGWLLLPITSLIF